ncbi:hypothetical protein QO200_15770 [Flavobacterium sp. Arc3]|jgi:uncharacterized membrane protein YagU involved in acid resistance|uniref:DUF6789 family protein n=1 Tax=Flavobacterium sp. Arc3 TaxID=3046686 RepID=UPI00352C70A3
MNTKIQKSVLAGIIGTVIMTAVMMISAMIGMPKVSPPSMLSGALGMPMFVGWIMHFMIGIVFAFAYTYLCIFKWKISNVYLKGAIFGVIAFVFAQIMMAIMGAMMPMPEVEGPMILKLIGGLMGHIIFGMAVAKTVGNAYCADKSCETN